MTDAEMAEQRRATYAAFDETQELAGRRAGAMLGICLLPGSSDKRLVRTLWARLDEDRPFTPRQVEVAAFLAWRYRRQIDASLVPAAPVRKP